MVYETSSRRVMQLPDKFNPQEGEKNYLIKKTIDQLIDFLQAHGLAEEIEVTPRPIVVPKPAAWSNTDKPSRDWEPLNGNPEAMFWMPPVGNMVHRDNVPADVLARYQDQAPAPAELEGEEAVTTDENA